MKKLIIITITFLNLNIASAVQIIASPGANPSQPDQWINVYFNNGYTLDYDSHFINQCNNRLNSLTPPAGHTLFKKFAHPYTIRRREDPYGRGYYLDKAIICQGTYINSNDCVDAGNAFNPGEFTFTSEIDYNYCVERTTFYQCQSGSWNYNRTEERLLPNCIMP